MVGTAVDAFLETLAVGRGVLVPPEDPDALAAALHDVLSGTVPRPRPVREIAERHGVAGIYESTYRALAATADAAAAS